MNALGIKLLIGVFLLAAAIFGWNWYTDSLVADGYKQGVAATEKKYKDAELKAIQEVRKEEGRRIAALQGVIDESKKDLEGARAAAAAASDAGQRLRDQLAALRRRGLGTNPATAGSRPSTDATERVLSDLQRSTHEAEERVARYADEARIAGRACEAAYHSLTP